MQKHFLTCQNQPQCGHQLREPFGNAGLPLWCSSRYCHDMACWGWYNRKSKAPVPAGAPHDHLGDTQTLPWECLQMKAKSDPGYQPDERMFRLMTELTEEYARKVSSRRNGRGTARPSSLLPRESAPIQPTPILARPKHSEVPALLLEVPSKLLRLSNETPTTILLVALDQKPYVFPLNSGVPLAPKRDS